MQKSIFTILVFLLISNIFAQKVATLLSDVTKKVDDALAIDSKGNIYGSSFIGRKVYKISKSGSATVFASGFKTPNGIALDSKGQLYVCDLSANRIFKLSESGVFLDTFIVTTPSGIVKSFASDTMLFTQYTGNKLSSISPEGNIQEIISGAPMKGAIGMTFDNEGQLYVANFTDRKIFRLENEQNLIYVATVPGPSNGGLGYVTYAQGSLWATSYNGHKIYQIYQNFVDSIALYSGSTLGSIDGSIEMAKFNFPNGIISSITGDSLYLSEFGTGKIRVISFNDTTVGLDTENEIAKVSVYPNPSNEFIHIDGFEAIERVDIMDLKGQIIISSTETSINISHLSVGTYIIKIINKVNGIKHITFLKT